MSRERHPWSFGGFSASASDVRTRVIMNLGFGVWAAYGCATADLTQVAESMGRLFSVRPHLDKRQQRLVLGLATGVHPDMPGPFSPTREMGQPREWRHEGSPTATSGIHRSQSLRRGVGIGTVRSASTGPLGVHEAALGLAGASKGAVAQRAAENLPVGVLGDFLDDL